MAEMRAGGRSVGTSEAGVQASITGAQAWKEADAWEKRWNKDDGPSWGRDDMRVHVVAVRDAKDTWWMHTSVPEKSKETVTFPPELFVKYPSPTLRTQIMLLFG
jgi:hypothetical protein